MPACKSDRGRGPVPWRRHTSSPTQPGAAPAATTTHQRALHCFADLRTNSDEIRAHWFRPYFMTAALRISSYARVKRGAARRPTPTTSAVRHTRRRLRWVC